jgi:hypothetical protein
MEELEPIEKITDIRVSGAEIVVYFNVRDAEEPTKVEDLLDNFEDAEVRMTKDAAVGQVILSITAKGW